mmetsp:Transcript_14368/g.29353  ORF Transcript_14368/g.29353 Transcript_14368/m.29353 type:complete len:606 (+) Transcript_14368:85-1902(+)
MRRAVGLLLLVLALASASATPKAPAFGFCGNTAGSQCGGISPSGDVWEADESSCCPPQHMCVYKTMYYSECQPASHVPPSRTSTDAIAKRVLTEDAESVSDALDLFFLLINAQIVFFMQGGFAMLEVGIIQPKNAKSILFKNMLDMFVVALCWFMWGFGIAGNGASGAVSEGVTGDFGFGHGVSHDGSKRWGGISISNSASFIHSLTFAMTTTTIMSGGVAERMRVEVYIFLSAILSSLIFSSMVHWGWGADGFLATQGFVDFAGSCIVHLVGGSAALTGAIIVGPRRHRFAEDGSVVSFKSTSLVLSSLGAFMLAFSWISFNGSSTLSTKGDMMLLSSHAVLNTLLCLGSSGVCSVLIEFVSHEGTYDLPNCINSMLGGLVAITAPCAFIDNWSAILLGLFSAFVSKTVSFIVLNKFGIDDPLDAFTVHGANGVLGTIWVGLFARRDLLAIYGKDNVGLFQPDGKADLLGAQVLGCLLAFFFTVFSILAACIVYYYCAQVYKKLRPNAEVVVESAAEEEDLDDVDEDQTTVTTIDESTLGIRDRLCLALRVSKDAEIVGADFIYHEGNAFELTKNQVKLYNQEKNAQERIQRQREEERRARSRS